jgi:hypothetical protein
MVRSAAAPRVSNHVAREYALAAIDARKRVPHLP